MNWIYKIQPAIYLNEIDRLQLIEIFKLSRPFAQMFSKIKNLFSKEQAGVEQEHKEPFAHPKMGEGDSSQCPFMQKKMEPSTTEKCPVSGKTKASVESDSEQQQKPRGGCPFMGGSDKKKNPSLGLSSQGFDEPFVSKFKYYLSSNKLDFSAFKKNGKPQPTSRYIFDKYPIYLQHTLFYNGEDYKKVRGLQCCSRFMAYEELREKGNKYYNKGKFYTALDYYERALSLFSWLEHHQNLNQSKISSDINLKSEQSIDQLSENQSKINIELKQDQSDPSGQPFNELKDKYKEFFITYCDDNVREFDGQELTQTPDVDMRKSLLVQVYLNMAAAYINLQHYSLAEQVINDGMALTDRVSQLYFRKAQSIGYRKDSSVAQLQIAKELIQKAIEMRPNEKIFSTANKNILKMLNLHDSEEAYLGCQLKINQALDEAIKTKEQLTTRVYNRAKEIHQIEQRMIEQGKVPRQNLDQNTLHNTTEMKILDRMMKKYARVVQFYTEGKNPEQVTLAKKEFQQILRISNEVNNIFAVELHQSSNQLGGLGSEKIQKRVNIIKTKFAETIYNSGRFNFTMLEWVIKEIVKEEAEAEKQRKDEEQKLNPTDNVVSTKGYSKLVYLVLLIPLLFIAVNYFVI